MKITSLLTASLLATASLVLPAQAQTSSEYLGEASGGQSVTLDRASLSVASQSSVNFTYYLGGEQVVSQANCPGGYWTTFSDGAQHRPQSAATQMMLNEVCSYLSSNRASAAPIATVIDPPSNVRDSPNGNIICTIPDRRQINVYRYADAANQWLYTNACGSNTDGVIHISQIRF